MGTLSYPVAELLESDGEAVEPQSFETFFTENRRALTSYLRRRMSSDADVQEVVQESYARILNYGYGGSRSPAVWKALLYRIATNLVHSRGRMDKSHNVAGQSSIDDFELASEEPSQERVVAAQQELQIVRQAILGMSPKCRSEEHTSELQSLMRT